MKDLETQLTDSTVLTEHKSDHLRHPPLHIRENISYFTSSPTRQQKSQFPLPKHTRNKIPIKKSMVYSLLYFVFQRNQLLCPKLIFKILKADFHKILILIKILSLIPAEAGQLATGPTFPKIKHLW